MVREAGKHSLEVSEVSVQVAILKSLAVLHTYLLNTLRCCT